MDNFITLNQNNIDGEHICCAISDKKSTEGTILKKEWLKKEFDNGYVFRRLNERAKVFIEYCPSENAWIPIDVRNYLFLNCFWVAGQYKGKGYGKALLEYAINDAKAQNRDGLITVTGLKKFHFMSDPKWLLKQGFEVTDTTPSGFNLLVYKLKNEANNPSFEPSARQKVINHREGLVAYYSNRCPFTEYHVNELLPQTAHKRNIPLRIIKLNSLDEARLCPSPATIFSLFYNGKFVTTDVSACLDNRFDKIVKAH